MKNFLIFILQGTLFFCFLFDHSVTSTCPRPVESSGLAGYVRKLLAEDNPYNSYYPY